MAVLQGLPEAQPGRIARTSLSVEIHSDFTVADADEADLRGCAGAILIVPAGVTTGTITIHVASESGGTYYPLNDATGAPVTLSVEASQAYDLPEAIFAAAFMKLQCENNNDFDGVLLMKG